MLNEIKLSIHQIVELLIDSYKTIDYRCILYKKHDNWNRILTVLRFSNQSQEEINHRFLDLSLNKFSIKNLKIEYGVINISEWESFLIGIYDDLNEEVEIFEPNEFHYNYKEYEKYEESFLSEFKASINTKSARSSLLTENEIKNYNIINYYYCLHDLNEHHNKFSDSLNEEVMLLGEDNIYDVINRVMQLDGYSSQNSLYISILMPIYIKIRNLSYESSKLSGTIEFHKIFSGSKIFFRIFSEPTYKIASLKGTEELSIDFEHKGAKAIKHEYYEIPILIDFKNYDCDPNFEIRVFWEKFHENYLVTFQKSFGSPRYMQQFEELKVDLSEGIQNLEISNYQYLIDPGISIDDDYKKIITNINEAFKRGLYDCVYILVRKLLENYLIDCLRLYYSMKQTDKFYNKGKFLSFNTLKLNFNKMINEDNFRAAVSPIQQAIIDYLDIFRESGNASAHSFFSIDHQQIMEDNKERLKILLELLSKIFRGLKKVS